MVSLLTLGLVLQYNIMAPRAAERHADASASVAALVCAVGHRLGGLEEQAGGRIPCHNAWKGAAAS